eukprot:Skav218619  [mRNA]  locus=scaffold3208:134332:135240:- [translate_table: standard]
MSKCLKPTSVDSTLKEVFKLAFGSEGPKGIPPLLQKLKVHTRLELCNSLRPGDIFPEELGFMRVDSMNVGFEDGEYVVAELDGNHLLGRVVKWNHECEARAVHMRQYSVQLSPREPPKRLFIKNLYKISGQDTTLPAAQRENQLVLVDSADDGIEAGYMKQDEEKALADLNEQLESMFTMEEEECRKLWIRLCLTWHPDTAKSGFDTEFNQKMFCLVTKAREQYSKQKGGKTQARTVLHVSARVCTGYIWEAEGLDWFG